MSIENVVNNGYCIGCGGCSFASRDSIKIEFKDDGFYRANINNEISTIQLDLASKVCPFSSESKNEDYIGKNLYGDKKHSEYLGYYNNVYAGKIKDDLKRVNSSSGGLTTWVAEKLLCDQEIDSVVHVKANLDGVFEYTISKSKEELHQIHKKKSRYYPVTYADLKDYLVNTTDKVLFIGVPCFVKSIRLLQYELGIQSIKYVFSLLCGHMKSAGFGQALAWESGVKPDSIKSLDFRVKKEGTNANNYYFEVKNYTGEVRQRFNNGLFVSNWGWGFFKNKACDYCDDVAGELADATFGDAWIDRYVNDYLGTNVLVTRNDTIDKILKLYQEEIFLESIPLEDFVDSQGGNYRHRVEGLRARINHSKSWVPPKREYLFERYNSDPRRDDLYVYRELVSQKSIEKYNLAKKYNSFFLFKILMVPYIIKLDYIDGGLRKVIKNFIKTNLPHRIWKR